MKNNQILVTGIERSGSTIIAKIIQMCGVYTGVTTDMCENIAIKELVDDYFKSHSVDVKGQYPLIDPKDVNIPSNWKSEVEKVMDTNASWMYKNGRIGHMWQVWHYAFPNAKWIIVRRRTGDIINSCMKTGHMTGYTDEEGWKSWIHYHEERYVEMITEGLDVKTIWPHRMIDGDYRQMVDMIDWLGLRWNENIVPFVENKLVSWNKRKT